MRLSLWSYARHPTSGSMLLRVVAFSKLLLRITLLQPCQMHSSCTCLTFRLMAARAHDVLWNG